MRLYQTTTEFNCGVDLHARQMYVCVLDILAHRLARAIFYMLKHGMTFSMELFCARQEQRAA